MVEGIKCPYNMVYILNWKCQGDGKVKLDSFSLESVLLRQRAIFFYFLSCTDSNEPAQQSKRD